MAYKSIVSFVCGATPDATTLNTATAFAENWGGHLSVCTLGIDRMIATGQFAGATAVALQQNFEEAQATAQSGSEAARHLLAGAPIASDVEPLPIYIGSATQVVADRAQYSDLVVLPKPYGEKRELDEEIVTEAALFGTRAPVLVVPQAHRDLSRPRAVIAWNNSPEALAAVRAALPLLKRAPSVDICIIDPPSHGPERSDPGGRLAQMLSRHGVRANVSVLAKTLPRVSDVIRRHLTDGDADLLVMGAYGHSRLREAILGGATRNMLEDCEIPVMLAH